MKIFFAFLLIIFLAFSGYHLSFRGFRLPVPARKFYLTGTEFLFLGLLLGPEFGNIFDARIIQGLDPLSGLVLGWVGLLFGYQFEVNKLRRFPPGYFQAAFLEGMVTFAFVFGGCFFVQFLLYEAVSQTGLAICITLAAFSACTAQTGLSLVAPDLITRRRETVHLLRYISSFDGLIALILFSVVFLMRSQPDATSVWERVLALRVFLIFVVVLGFLLLYVLFFTERRSSDELVLVMIGMAVLTSGTATILNFSPLIINFLMGVCLVNFSRQKERIYHILSSVEKPVYIMLMAFLGLSWKIDSLVPIVFAVLFTGWRFVGKLAGGGIVRRLLDGVDRFPGFLGLGLLDPGGLSLAVLLDYQRGGAGGAADVAVSMAVISVIFSDMLSMVCLQRLFKKEIR